MSAEAPSSPTPPPAASPVSPPAPSPQSGLDQALAKLPGTAVQLFTIQKLSAALLESLRAQSADGQWKWALLGTIVAVVVPSLASSLSGVLDRYLSSKRS